MEQDPAGQTNSDPKPEKLFAGKYRTPEDLEQGYLNSTREFQKLKAQDEARAERLSRLETELAAVRQARPDPVAEKFEENVGVPMAALDQRVDARIQEVLGTALRPFAEASRAQQQMQELYPDFDLQGVQKAVAKDPMVAESYNELLASNPHQAYVMGYQAWKAAKPARGQQAGPAETTAAGMPSNVQAPGEAALDEQRYRDLLNRAIDTGDYTGFLRERFKGTSLDALAEDRGW